MRCLRKPHLLLLAITGILGLATSPAHADITLSITEGSSTTTLSTPGSTLTFSGLSTPDYTAISGSVTMTNMVISMGGKLVEAAWVTWNWPSTMRRMQQDRHSH